MKVLPAGVFILLMMMKFSATDGFIQPRIINGFNATAGQFPWVATISGKTKTGTNIFCNGALISNQIVLTVAQCLDNLKKVSLGLGSIKREVPLVHTTSSNFALHPQYDATTFANNIAIIRLSNPLSFTKYIRSVQLPSIGQRPQKFIDAVATISGYGRISNSGLPASRLQFGKVKILPEKECQITYGSMVSNENTMCSVGFDHILQGACPNDNGSPLVVSEKLIDTLIGLVSFISTKGCDVGHPTGYVRVGPYINWIHDITGIAVRN